jgi:hypothetical protein
MTGSAVAPTCMYVHVRCCARDRADRGDCLGRILLKHTSEDRMPCRGGVRAVGVEQFRAVGRVCLLGVELLGDACRVGASGQGGAAVSGGQGANGVAVSVILRCSSAFFAAKRRRAMSFRSAEPGCANQATATLCGALESSGAHRHERSPGPASRRAPTARLGRSNGAGGRRGAARHPIILCDCPAPRPCSGNGVEDLASRAIRRRRAA